MSPEHAANALVQTAREQVRSSVLDAMALIRTGKLRALGSTTGRIAQLPDVPSMAEAGLPMVDAAPDFGIVAPANLPEAIVAQLEARAQTVCLLHADTQSRGNDRVC